MQMRRVEADYGKFGTAISIALGSGDAILVAILIEAVAEVNADVGAYGTAIRAALRSDNMR